MEHAMFTDHNIRVHDETPAGRVPGTEMIAWPSSACRVS